MGFTPWLSPKLNIRSVAYIITAYGDKYVFNLPGLRISLEGRSTIDHYRRGKMVFIGELSRGDNSGNNGLRGQLQDKITVH